MTAADVINTFYPVCFSDSNTSLCQTLNLCVCHDKVQWTVWTVEMTPIVTKKASLTDPSLSHLCTGSVYRTVSEEREGSRSGSGSLYVWLSTPASLRAAEVLLSTWGQYLSGVSRTISGQGAAGHTELQTSSSSTSRLLPTCCGGLHQTTLTFGSQL